MPKKENPHRKTRDENHKTADWELNYKYFEHLNPTPMCPSFIFPFKEEEGKKPRGKQKTGQRKKTHIEKPETKTTNQPTGS